MNPELAAVKRARRRHRREGDDAQGTSSVKGFEMSYKVCSAAPSDCSLVVPNVWEIMQNNLQAALWEAQLNG
jgi:hypothetical protein